MVVQRYIEDNYKDKKLELCMYDKEKEEEVGILKTRKSIYRLIGYCNLDKVKITEFADLIMIEANIGCGINATEEITKLCVDEENKLLDIAMSYMTNRAILGMLKKYFFVPICFVIIPIVWYKMYGLNTELIELFILGSMTCICTLISFYIRDKKAALKILKETGDIKF